MIKGLIFDMDGTILNTLKDITIAANHALKTHHLKTKSEDEIKQAVGSGAMTLIKRIAPRDYGFHEVTSLYQAYQSYYDAHNAIHTKPYRGILTLLKKLKKEGYLLAVVSNKYDYLVKSLNYNVFHGLFDQAIGESDGIPIKPAPDMLLKAMNQLGLNRQEVLFIGDSEIDIKTAQNANIISIGVTWGFRDKDALMAHKADYIVDHPKDIYPIIKEVVFG